MVDFRKLRLDAALGRTRASGKVMPLSSEERQGALTIMEWAHESPEAEEVAAELVAGYREFCCRPFVDEAHWRTAFDLALGIWGLAHAVHLAKQAAF